MQVACPSCGHVLTIPPERAVVPNLKAKCRCGTLFPVAGHGLVAASAPAAPPSLARAASPSAAVPKIAPAATDRVAAIRAANAQASRAPAVVMAAAASALAPPPLPPRPASVPAGAPMRAAAAVPRPAPAIAARPAPSATSEKPGPTAVDKPGATAEKPRTVPVPWRRCQNHPQVRSDHVCPKCAKGFCDACAQKVQGAATCPSCAGLCVAAASYEEIQDKAKHRERSMLEEIGVIAGYPLRDRMAYVLLALVTWFFGLFGLFGGFVFIMTVLSKGVLTWYSFNALSKVSIGNMRDVMPELRDLSGIVRTMRLSLAALVISAGPLFLCLLLIPGAQILAGGHPVAQSMPRLEAVHAQPPSVAGPLTILAIVVAFIWMVGYLPVALTAAALSKRILSTLSPVVGADTIRKMGSTYWQALGVYAVIVLVQSIGGWGLRLIPFAGGLAASFVDAYAALAIGCTLGMAVFKKGAEPG